MRGVYLVFVSKDLEIDTLFKGSLGRDLGAPETLSLNGLGHLKLNGEAEPSKERSIDGVLKVGRDHYNSCSFTC